MEIEYLNVRYKSGTVFNVYGFVVVNNIMEFDLFIWKRKQPQDVDELYVVKNA